MKNLSKPLIILLLSGMFLSISASFANDETAVYIKGADGKDVLYGSFVRLQGDEYVFHTIPTESEFLCASKRVTGVHTLNIHELIQSINKSRTETVYAYRAHGRSCAAIPYLSYGSIGDAELDMKEQYKVYDQYEKFLVAFAKWQKSGNTTQFSFLADSKKQQCFRTNKSLTIFGYRIGKNGKASASIDGCLNAAQYDVADITIDKNGNFKVKIRFQLPPI